MQSILIVEDDLTIQKSYAQILKQVGYDVSVADDITQARRILLSSPISLLLLDIMLPGEMNGFDFLAEMKRDEKLKTIPVIIMTNLESEKQTGLDMGANDYISKTAIGPNDLIQKVKQFAS